MAKDKRQLRAEAVERLRNMDNWCDGAKSGADYVKALLWDLRVIDDEHVRDALIELLSDEPTNGTTSETNGIARGTNGDGLSECPHCGSVAEYVSEHAKGKRWAVACTMTSKVAADEGKPMCRCRTPFFRDKGQARDVWNRRAAVTDHDFAMAVHDGDLWGKCSECGDAIELSNVRVMLEGTLESNDELRERIAELEALLRAHERGMREAWAEHEKRDALIRDMARELRGLNDGGISTDCMEYERRMRELGIEVNDDEI